MLREDFRSQFGAKAQKYRRALEMRYGNAAARVGYAEAFEICEYGAQPDEGQIRRLFPFFPGK
jgi:hypothetical protein